MSTLSKEAIETANTSDAGASQASASTEPASGQIHSDAVSLEVPLKVHGSKVTEIVRGVTPHIEPFEEQTSSMIVFPHGGVLRMSTPVNPGQMLVLTNLKSRQDAICRVVKVRAYSNSASYVEVEFTHRQPGYWGVYFESDAAEALVNDSKPASAPSPATNVAKPASGDSSFIHFGSQEDVQPAASSTNSASLPAAKTPRAVTSSVPSNTIAEIPTVKISQSQTPSNSTTTGLNSAPPTLPISSAASSGARTRDHEEDASVAGEKIEATSLEPTANTAGATFGSRLGSTASSEQNAEGNQNWLLIAACGAALFLAIGGGILLLHHKSSGVAASAVQPSVDQSTVTQPVTAPSAPGTVTPSGPGANSASTVRQTPVAPVVKPTKDMVVVKESATANDPTAQPQPIAVPPAVAASTRSSVPSVFGTLNAHPVTTNHNVTTAAPDVDLGSPSVGDNALLGITSAGTNSSLPPPAFNANIPVPVGGRVKEPQLVTRVLPEYPLLARQEHTQGDVVVQVVVDKAGRVAEAKAISGPSILRRVAIDAVRRWKYEPPMLDGQAIAVQLLVTVRFQL